jgi:hypothetical protein
MQNETQTYLESFRRVNLEDLPSYSKSEIDLEILNEKSLLTTSAEPAQLPSNRINGLHDGAEDRQKCVRSSLFKDNSNGDYDLQLSQNSATDPYQISRSSLQASSGPSD